MIPRSFFQLHPAILNRHAINHKLNPLHIDLQLEGWVMTALAPISCVSPSINPALFRTDARIMRVRSRTNLTSLHETRTGSKPFLFSPDGAKYTQVEVTGQM